MLPGDHVMYQSMYPNTQFPINFSAPSVGIQYVNGKQSAEAYQTQPNQEVLLMDSNEDKFYIVKTDASNFKTIETYTFAKEEEKKVSYVTHEEFDGLKKMLEEYKPLLESLKE